MTDYQELDTQLRAWLADDAAIAQAAAGLQDDPEHGWGFVPRDDYSRGGGTITPHIGSLWEYESVAHVTRFHPAAVLADIAGKRALLDHVAAWPHEYVDGDTWFSCSQAVGPHDPDEVPGSGCADENRAGDPCDCHLDDRRLTVLRCVAAGYVGRPEFKPEWRHDD